MANIFTQDQTAEIGNIISEQIAKAMGTPVSQTQTQAINLSDPLTQAYDDGETNLVKAISNPHEMPVFMRNKKGRGQWFFISVQKMNALRDARNERSGFMGGINKT